MPTKIGLGYISPFLAFLLIPFVVMKKIGLLSPPQRKESGVRIYFQKDIDTLSFLQCLKRRGSLLKR
ncbi:hypothetical protein B6257_09660 [Bacillus velezensis]|nr:hypothetical protein B6257_09660 [Bacillus velezensis]